MFQTNKENKEFNLVWNLGNWEIVICLGFRD